MNKNTPEIIDITRKGKRPKVTPTHQFRDRFGRVIANDPKIIFGTPWAKPKHGIKPNAPKA